MICRLLLVFACAFGFIVSTACAQERYGEVYDETAGAAEDIDSVLADARSREVPALLVFGANWCHDSRGLAHALETHDALNDFITEHYALVFIDVGERDRNLDQLARFGVAHIFGTPTLVVASGDGVLLNSDSVHHWRAVDDADPADIGAYLAGFADVEPPIMPDQTADLARVVANWPPYQTALAALETAEAAGEVDAEAAAIRADYYQGLARSMARRAMGLEAQAQELSAAQRQDVTLEYTGADFTEAVLSRLSESDPNLVRRADRELRRYED